MSIILAKQKHYGWTCLLCNSQNETLGLKYVEREGLNCRKCQSSWRERALVLTFLDQNNFSVESFIEKKIDFSLKAIGIGDSFRVQAALAGYCNYTNTFLDAFPRLDIEESSNIFDYFDCITCSDVLEHVVNLDNALYGLSKLMKPKTGKCIVSVPINDHDYNIEHYPDMTSFEIIDNYVKWVDSRGIERVSGNPKFHGGDSRTLEIRTISRIHFEKMIKDLGMRVSYGHSINARYGVPGLVMNHGFFFINF